MSADRPADGSPPGDTPLPGQLGVGSSPFGVAPSVAMEESLLPRQGLSLGASGQGGGQRNFKLLAAIDRGGMGELFLAEVSAPGRRTEYAVLKRLLADLLDDDKYVAMFRAEAEVMSKLRHENIVRVIDLPTIGGNQCMAMEYVRGRNVQQILSRCEEVEGRIPPEIVLPIMCHVLRGLHYAHTFVLPDGRPLGLVHRDVSPGNILVSFDGDVKLTDFGIAKSQMSAVSTTVGIVKGKARYLSPEQILGEKATPRSDIFSCACVTYEMLTGEPAFDRRSVPKTLYAIVNGEKPDIESQLSFRAPLLVQILNRAFSVDPVMRIQTAHEFAEGLDAAAQLFGNRADADAMGGYLRDLFRGIVDPLASFFPPEVPTIAEKPQDVITHGPPPPPPPSEPSYSPMFPPALEDTDNTSRPDRPLPVAPSTTLPPAEVVLDDFDPEKAPTNEHPKPQIAPSKEALAAAADSAHSTTGSHSPNILRGEPLNPPATGEGPSIQNGDVDEALAVLAYLQDRQQQHREVPTPPPASGSLRNLSDLAVPPARAPVTVEEYSADERAEALRKRGLMVSFVLGITAGVLGTLAIQSLIPDPPPPVPQEPPKVIAKAKPIEAKAKPKEPEEKPEEKQPEAKPEEKPKEPEEKPAEKEEPKPPKRTKKLPTIDVVYPRGARVYIDGRQLKRRVPVRGYVLKPGRHRIKVRRGRYKRDLSFSVKAGERLEMSRKLRRKKK